MIVVMGATGRVGSVVAEELLKKGEQVAVLTRDPDGASAWREKGAEVVEADAEDERSLHNAFRMGQRAFLLNPPGDPSGDSDETERRTIRHILGALAHSGLEKVVAASTYGARKGDAIGDLSTLWELEEGLRAQSIPAAINRGAYYMSNWTQLADTVRESGKLPSMFPADTVMPMVAPADLGRAAARRLLSSSDDTGVCYIEGPERYTPQDVAHAFAVALGRPVRVDVAPREAWEGIYENLGFSAASARSFARMTAVSLEEEFDAPSSPEQGVTGLQEFITQSLSGEDASRVD